MAKTRIGSNAQFVGAGPSAFSVLGEHCYAYSGNVTLSTTAKDQLSFTTPKGYIVAQFVFTGPASFTNPSGERDCLFRVDFNGIPVAWSHRLTGSNQLGTGETTLNIIIPPYTTVEVLADSSGSDSDYFTAVVMTGRMYDA